MCNLVTWNYNNLSDEENNYIYERFIFVNLQSQLLNKSITFLLD